jgi:hypothetical protein
MTDSLSLEWSYTPADFFEAPVDYSEPTYTVHIEGGQVVATFCSDQPESAFPVVHKEVESRFLGAQPYRNKPYQLSGYITRRARPDGTIEMGLSASIAGHADVRFDAVLLDAAGNLIADTKRERIEATNQFAQLASKHRNDPVAEALLKSYNAAITNPPNELTHIYEIRDALKKKFGQEAKARRKLGIAEKRWKRLGQLANDEPLLQGRHRGQKIGQLREATETELAEAREIVREMIRKYLEYLP